MISGAKLLLIFVVAHISMVVAVIAFEEKPAQANIDLSNCLGIGTSVDEAKRGGSGWRTIFKCPDGTMHIR